MKSSASSAPMQPVLMQTVRPEPSLRHRFAIDPTEKALYEGLRHQVPILDAAITKIVRLTGGYRITDHIGAELFVQHFSNGNTAEENHSYAFYGTGLTYSF